MRDILNKKIKLIEQSISSLDELIDRDNIDEEDLTFLIKKDLKERLMVDHPECFLPLSVLNVGMRPFFPICNRSAIHDPKLIEMSKKLAEKLIGNPKVDQEHLKLMMMKLSMLSQHINQTGLGPI